MSSKPFDDYELLPFSGDLPENDPFEEEESWQMTHCLSYEQAIESGALVPYQFPYNTEMIDCCFSKSLWQKYRCSQSKLKQICLKGMALLAVYDESDDWGEKRRVITDDIWVIDNSDGLLFLRPQDY